MKRYLNLNGISWVLDGDTDRAMSVRPLAQKMMHVMKMQNVNNLDHIWYTHRMEDGTVIRVERFFGRDKAYVYCEPPPPVKKGRIKKIRVERIVPAIEAFNADGKFVGLVICESGTFEPPYTFVAVNKDLLYPFGWGQWQIYFSSKPFDEMQESVILQYNAKVISDIPPTGKYIVDQDKETYYNHEEEMTNCSGEPICSARLSTDPSYSAEAAGEWVYRGTQHYFDDRRYTYTVKLIDYDENFIGIATGVDASPYYTTVIFDSAVRKNGTPSVLMWTKNPDPDLNEMCAQCLDSLTDGHEECYSLCTSTKSYMDYGFTGPYISTSGNDWCVDYRKFGKIDGSFEDTDHGVLFAVRAYEKYKYTRTGIDVYEGYSTYDIIWLPFDVDPGYFHHLYHVTTVIDEDTELWEEGLFVDGVFYKYQNGSGHYYTYDDYIARYCNMPRYWNIAEGVFGVASAQRINSYNTDYFIVRNETLTVTTFNTADLIFPSGSDAEEYAYFMEPHIIPGFEGIYGYGMYRLLRIIEEKEVIE